MKRLLLTLFTILFTMVGASAQDSQEHFKFKGIAIDGSIENFGRQLEAGGFVKIDDYIYRGEFLRQACIVQLVADSNNDIWRVAATSPSTDTWSTLEGLLDNYISLYTEKYGKPQTLCKEFHTYTGDDASLNMLALKDGECDYYAQWTVKYGTIEIRLVKGNGYRTGAVRVVYTDNANKANVRKADLSEI